MPASSKVEEAGEEESDGEEERGGGGGATNNLIRLAELFLKISDDEQKIRLASIHAEMPRSFVSLGGQASLVEEMIET